MREVVCESGNIYHLALGPQILEIISGSYGDIIPEDIFKKINDYAKSMEQSSIDILSSDDALQELQDRNILTASDAMKLLTSQKNHALNTLKKCVKKMNGVRILDHPYFKEEFSSDELYIITKSEKEDIFYEEVMPFEDYSEIMNVINETVFEFRLGIEIQEKSKLFSLAKEEGKAGKKIFRSQSSV